MEGLAELMLYNFNEILFPNGLDGISEWLHFELQQKPEMVSTTLLYRLEEKDIPYSDPEPRAWFVI